MRFHDPNAGGDAAEPGSVGFGLNQEFELRLDNLGPGNFVDQNNIYTRSYMLDMGRLK